MATILRDIGPGERIGTALGGGLGAGFEALANLKLQDYAQRQQMATQKEQYNKFWTGILPQGTNPQLIESLSSGDPAMQKTIFDRLQGLNIPLGDQAQQQMGGMFQQGMQPEQYGSVQQPGQYGVAQQPGQYGTAQQPGGLSIGAAPAERRYQGKRFEHAQDVERAERYRAQDMAIKEQEHVEKLNKPVVDYYDKARPIAEEALSKINRMKYLVSTGKVDAGITKASYNVFPLSSRSDETQEFDTLSNELASLTTSAKKGITTGVKLAWEKGSKATLFHNRRVQNRLLNGAQDIYSKLLLGDEIKRNAVASNNNRQPENLDDIISKELHKHSETGRSFNDILNDYTSGSAGGPSGPTGGPMAGPTGEQQGVPQQQVEAKRLSSLGPLPGAQQQGAPQQQVGPMGQSRNAPIPGAQQQQGQRPELHETDEELEEGEGLDIIPRLAAQYGSRIVEGVLGIPGNLEKLGKSFGLTNPQFERIKEEWGVSPWPTSEDIREFAKEKSGGKTEPSGPAEESIGNVVSTVTSLMVPLPFVKGLGAVKAVAMAGLGEGAKFLSKNIGLGPLAQEAVKLGTMVVTGMAGTRDAAKNIMEKGYEISDGIFSKFSAESAPISRKLGSIFEEVAPALSKGRKAVSDKLFGLMQYLEGSNIVPLNKISGSIKQLNSLSGVVSENERHFIGKIKDVLFNTLENSAKTNQEVAIGYNALRKSNELYGGLEATQSLRDMYNEMPKGAITSKAGRILLGVGGAAAGMAKFPMAGGLAAGGAALGGAGLTIVNAMKLMLKSPTARALYINVGKAAAKNSVKAYRHYAEKLDDELLKLEKNQ